MLLKESIDAVNVVFKAFGSGARRVCDRGNFLPKTVAYLYLSDKTNHFHEAFLISSQIPIRSLLRIVYVLSRRLEWQVQPRKQYRHIR